MTSGTHLFRAVVSLSLIVCACGGATRPASSPTPITSLAALMLTTSEFTAAVSGDPRAVPATRFTDSGQAGMDTRRFFAGDGSTLAQVQLFLLHTQAADSFYAYLLSSSCPPGGQTTLTHLKVGTAAKADEYGCVKNAGFRVAFEQAIQPDSIIGDVVTSPESGAEALARAESAKITQIFGV
jgi:hypothetical protein